MDATRRILPAKLGDVNIKHRRHFYLIDIARATFLFH